MEDYISTKEATKIGKVSSETLRRWADENKIRFVKTETRRYKYHKQDLLHYCGFPLSFNKKNAKEKQKICYCRVSTRKQLDDLERQKLYLGKKYPNYRIVTDIGSGINWKRKGLQTILGLSMRGELEEVVVAHRDRLCRFSFELIQWILQENGSKLTVINREEHKSDAQELAEDLLSITTIYACKHMGRRKYKDKESETQSQSSSEEDI